MTDWQRWCERSNRRSAVAEHDPADIELVARATAALDGDTEWADLSARDQRTYLDYAGHVLDALAGRLLPPGGQVRVELTGGQFPEDFDQDDPCWADQCPEPHEHNIRRTVTTWPDGSQLTGAWEAVDETEAG